MSNANGNGTSNQGNTDGVPSTGKSNNLAFVGMALFIGLALFVILYYIIKSIIKKLREPLPSPDHMGAAAADNTNQSRNLGLDPEDISLLPAFPYQQAKWRCRNKGHEHTEKVFTVDCAVCLGELEEGETVRVLPTCKHYFHVKCIDMWLSANSSCPVCRAHPEPEKVSSGLVAISPPWHQLLSSRSSDMRQFSFGSCLGSPFVMTPRKSPIGTSPFHISWQGSPSMWITTPPRNLQERLAHTMEV